ncbi:MAG: Sua5/YciO/YrdC/YwlC family protein [Planctomycetota bacterium]
MLHSVPNAPADPDLLAATLDALRTGAVVALPTETVYGLAARGDDPRALERLERLKGRPAEHRFTRVVAGTAALAEAVELRPGLERLAERYWPGPLTLVVRVAPGAPLSEDGWLGLRVPAHEATRDLAERADFPIALTSANRHGDRPAVEAATVVKTFGDEVALVWDGGPARLGEASGVLRVGRGSFEMLRECLIDLPTLRRTAGRRIVYVCTGNTCRSPMAAGLTRALLTERVGGSPEAFGFEIASMGVTAPPGSPAAKEAIDVLAERGIDITAHRSRRVDDRLLAETDEILCLTRSHRDALLGVLSPRHADRVRLLHPDGLDIPDPIGGDATVYRKAADTIESCIRARLDGWA